MGEKMGHGRPSSIRRTLLMLHIENNVVHISFGRSPRILHLDTFDADPDNA